MSSVNINIQDTLETVSVAVQEVNNTVTISATSTAEVVNVSIQEALNGLPGEGVPIGGSAGQVLSKIDAEDYNTQWINPDQASVPIEVTQHITRTDNPHNVQEDQIPEGIDYTLLFENALI